MIDRIVLTVYTLALAFVSGLMILVALAPAWIQPHVWLAEALESTRGQVLVGMSGAAFFAVSLRLIVFAFARRGGGQPVIHETAMGEVRISLDAVENLIKKVSRSVKGVREVKAVVSHSKDGLRAHLRGTVSPEVSIPEASEEIQNTVRQYVKRVVGVEISDISIEIDNIASDAHRRRLD